MATSVSTIHDVSEHSGQGSSLLGPLSIQVISAQFMVDLGYLSKQDPYINVKIGTHSESTTTKTRAGKSAIWGETLVFKHQRKLEGLVQICALDKNLLQDNIIGKTTIPLSELIRQQGQREIDLFDNSDLSKLTGRVLINVIGGESLSGQSISSEQDGDRGTSTATGAHLVGRSHSLHNQNLIIRVISAEFTHDIGLTSRQAPFIQILVGDQTAKTSSKSGAGLNAVWNEAIIFSKLDEMSEGRSCDAIISAWDKGLMKDSEIGNVKIPLDELLRNQGQQCEYKLYDAKDSCKLAGSVLLGVSLEGLGGKHGLGVGGPSGHVEHGTRNLAITVNSAQFLYDQGIVSKQDPYIIITIGDQTLKTKAKYNAGKTAAWDETLTFTDVERLDLKNQTVLIRALDKDMLIDDDIGRVVIPLSELVSSQGQREYELFSRGDLSKSKSVGRVLLTVSHGLVFSGTMGMGTAADSSGTMGSTY